MHPPPSASPDPPSRRSERRRAVLRALPAALLAALLAAGCSPEPVPVRPHVILVVVDTLRGDALDPDAPVETPVLDRLGADGVVFPRAFSHAPITLPSHTSLFSSRLPFETGVLNNAQRVPEELPLLAEWAAGLGYEPLGVVSLGTLGGDVRIERGFAAYDKDFFRVSPAPDVLARLRAELDARDPDRPLLLFAHFSDPHEPYNAHGALSLRATVALDGSERAVLETADMTFWRERFELGPGPHELVVEAPRAFQIRGLVVQRDGRRIEPVWREGELLSPHERVEVLVENEGEEAEYAVTMWITDVPRGPEARLRYWREVGFVDAHLGLLLDELRARGLYEESLVVFTSDHGESLGEDGHIGHVHGLSDAQLRVPLVIKPPRGDPRADDLAAMHERLVPLVDVVPTVLDLAGLPPLPGQRGSSLLEGGPEPVLVAQTHRPQAKRNLVCLRDGRYKMIYFVDEDRFEMYDLAADPREETDVFALRGDERPAWPERLREIAAASEAGILRDEDLDEETRRGLEALGYGG